MSKKTLSVILTIIFTLALSGCKNEDFFYETPSYEGPVSLTLDLSFNPLAEGVVTRGVDANLDFELRDLTVLFYDSQANEETGIPAEYFSYSDLTTEQEERVSDTEPHTRHTKVTMTMKSGGSYRIYAVANVADIPELDFSTISEKTLRETVIEWPEYSENPSLGKKNPLRYAIPDAMFGYFHVATNSSHDAEHKGEAGTASQDIIHHDTSYDFKTNVNRPAPIALNMSEITIHAWMKRVISRLTVGFDGSQLNRGVEIYIKSVHIKDAVKSCLLGHDNKAVALTDLLQYDATDQRLNHIYSSLEGAEGDAITKTKPYYPRNPDTDKATDYDDWYDYVHGDAASLDPKDPEPGAYTPVSLYFMENIQGKVANYNGPKEYPKAYALDYRSGSDYDKDNKPYGTYLEVEAYYRNTRKASQGKIIYRFMLGQNVTDDFNAERNRHYKLVLRFKGEANDVDWHIDYQEENPYFRIPYDLGDEDADFTFKDEANDETWFKNENWNQSYVWYAYDEDHNPIAEICKELIYYDPRGYSSETSLRDRTYYQVVTVYPIKSNGETDLRNGIIAQVLACDTDEPGRTYKTKTDGAAISMYYQNEKIPVGKGFRGDYVINKSDLTPDIASGGANSHDNYLYVEYNKNTQALKLIEAPLGDLLDTRPYLVRDYDQNSYPIVKIGGSYWFRENLRTTHVHDMRTDYGCPYNGHALTPYRSGVEPFEESCVYIPEGLEMYKSFDDDEDGTTYGYLYNFAAILGSDCYDPWSHNLHGIPRNGDEVNLIQQECTPSPEILGFTLGQDMWNEWQITPSGWHIPTGGSNQWTWWGEETIDNQYLMDYLGDNYLRAAEDRGSTSWPRTLWPDAEVKQRNLSGLSLLAIPADGVSAINYDISEDQLKSGNLTGVLIPFWTETMLHCADDYDYANPPYIVNNDDEVNNFGKGTLITRNRMTSDYAGFAKYFKAASEQYLPVRPVRHAFNYAAQPWSVLGDLWEGEE